MALLPVLSAMRGASRRLSTSAAVKSAVRGAGRRQLSTSTIVPWAAGHHDFRIESYTQVKKMMAIGQDIRSNDFVVGDRLWRILCYPNGSRKKHAGHLSIFLEYGSYHADGDTAAMVKMSILPDGRPWSPTYSRTSEAHLFSKARDTLGWDEFISHEDLEAGNHDGRALISRGALIKDDCLAVREKHLKDDCLIVRCDVSVAGPCLIR